MNYVLSEPQVVETPRYRFMPKTSPLIAARSSEVEFASAFRPTRASSVPVYPAVKKARSENTKDEVREAYEEHQQIKTLLAALSELNPDDESYEAKVKVLRDDVEHHVKEEESEMFRTLVNSSARKSCRH